MIAAGSLTLLFFAAAYILMSVRSNTLVRSAEKAKLEEVTRSEEKYRGLFENSLAGIVRLSLPDWKVLDSNEAIRTIFCCNTNDELEACIDRFPASSIADIEKKLAGDGFVSQMEIHAVRRDGKGVWILFSAKSLNDGMTTQAVLIDITERKRFEEKIKEQSGLLDQAEDAFIVIDSDGYIKYWNSGGELVYGWQSNEVVGRSLKELLYNETEDSDFHSAMADVLHFSEWRGEHSQTRKDGKKILVEGRWKTIDRMLDGQQSVLIVAADITEKRRIEARVARAQRAETIAVLTGGLAHDLQNILTPVKMSARLLKKRSQKAANTMLINAIIERARTGLQLVRNILTYGKGITVTKKPIDIKSILNEVAGNLERSLPQGIRFEADLARQKWRILGDASQLKQAFANLLVNAKDAVAKDGIIRLTAHDVPMDEHSVETYIGEVTGPHVVVEVNDTGKGIPAEDLERVFEPFFTTKERTGGTGLGLSIAHGIVTSHRGFITVESTPGTGTTFRVFLPALKSNPKLTKGSRH